MLLVRMRLVVCMFVCLFVCYNLFVCFTGNLGDWVLGRGGSLLLLEKLWDFLVQWDNIPDANCTGVKGEHCSVDAAPGGDVMATVF